MSTGMPRPLSLTDSEPSLCTRTSMRVASPASASSTLLSTTSQARWCSPFTRVSPMYIAGRWRTASRPSSTLIELASSRGSCCTFGSHMPGASQTELQLRDLPAGQPLVEAHPDLLAAEPRQFGEQRRGVDLQRELAVAEAHDLAVLALRCGQHGVERLRELVAR